MVTKEEEVEGTREEVGDIKEEEVAIRAVEEVDAIKHHHHTKEGGRDIIRRVQNTTKFVASPLFFFHSLFHFILS